MPKQVTEEQILEAVIEILLEKGYASATTRTMAQRAQISEMTLFRRFGSKARLVIRAVHYVLSKNEIDATYTGDVNADLNRILRHYQERKMSPYAQILPLMLLEIPRHPELKEVMEAPFANVSKIGALFMKYQAQNILRKEHPMHAVAGLLGPLIILKLLDGLGSTEIPDWTIEAHVRAYLVGRKLGSE